MSRAHLLPPHPRQVILGGLENINCVEEPSDRGGLFIGDIISTKKDHLLLKHDIQAIVCCSPESKSSVQGLETKYILAEDTPLYNMATHFEETYDFIRQNLLEGKNVLVHCHAGKSRSATVVIAFLMRDKKISLQQALALLRSKRPRVKPNEGFLVQLKAFEEQLDIVQQRVEEVTSQRLPKEEQKPLERRTMSFTKPQIAQNEKTSEMTEIQTRTSVYNPNLLNRNKENILKKVDINSSNSHQFLRVPPLPPKNGFSAKVPANQETTQRISIPYRCKLSSSFPSEEMLRPRTALKGDRSPTGAGNLSKK